RRRRPGRSASQPRTLCVAKSSSRFLSPSFVVRPVARRCATGEPAGQYRIAMRPCEWRKIAGGLAETLLRQHRGPDDAFSQRYALLERPPVVDAVDLGEFLLE